MHRKLVTKYEYISWLVEKLQKDHEEGKDIDWFFNELIKIYEPLLNSISKRVHNKKRGMVSFGEIKTRVLGIFFKSILDYNSRYIDKKLKIKEGEKFRYVYFSTYLKRKIPWDVLRLIKPPKIEYDDLTPDYRFVELDLIHPSEELEGKLSYNGNQIAISKNFVSLCRMTQKELKDDLCSDIMMLHFGYGFKNNELSELLNCSPQKVSLALLHLKKFWKANKDKILP